MTEQGKERRLKPKEMGANEINKGVYAIRRRAVDTDEGRLEGDGFLQRATAGKKTYISPVDPLRRETWSLIGPK